MALKIGSNGEEVRQLQAQLNLLPTNQARLAEDGQFGIQTQRRVLEFQGGNGLVPDGIVGPLTLGLIAELLGRILPPTPPAPPPAVRSINQEILGMTGPDNLIQQIFPPIMVISLSTFRAGQPSNRFQFQPVPLTVGRLGIFAAQKDGQERAIMLVLPQAAAPTRINICITQRFAQAKKDLDPLGWSNPLSPDFVRFALLKHVINRWGAQTLAAPQPTAFLYILRANFAKELGPFTNDGAFVVQVLEELRTLTNNAFSFDEVDAFTFSAGILDFNVFLNSVSNKLNLRAIYNIDPNPATTAGAGLRVARKQFLSGQTFRGALPPGFEFMPLSRWQNEPMFGQLRTFKDPPEFNYLHNHCMPLYAMHLGLQLAG